jgi:hypothetical protein
LDSVLGKLGQALGRLVAGCDGADGEVDVVDLALTEAALIGRLGGVRNQLLTV